MELMGAGPKMMGAISLHNVLSNHEAPRLRASWVLKVCTAATSMQADLGKKNPPQALNTVTAYKASQPLLMNASSPLANCPQCLCAPSTSAPAHCKYLTKLALSRDPLPQHRLHAASEHQPRLTNLSEMSQLSPSFLLWHPPECRFMLHKPQGVVVFVFSYRELFAFNALPDSCCD